MKCQFCQQEAELGMKVSEEMILFCIPCGIKQSVQNTNTGETIPLIELFDRCAAEAQEQHMLN